MIARWIVSRLKYLGVQDAPRKRRIDNGPSVYGTSANQITSTVTQKKWTKGKGQLLRLDSESKNNPNVLFEYKRLGRVRGFFCHLAMAYNIFYPFLRGFHLTLSRHLSQIDEYGWKLTDFQLIGYVEDRVEKDMYTRSEADVLIASMNKPEQIDPDKLVKPVSRCA